MTEKMYEARIPHWGKRWEVVYSAFDAESAAELLVEKYDSEHSLLKEKNGLTVEVRAFADPGNVKKFIVKAEAVVDYYAVEVNE